MRRQLEDRIDAIREDQRREREEAEREREREVLRYKPSYLRRLLKREPWRRAQLLDELHAAGVVDETGRFVDESSKGANPSSAFTVGIFSSVPRFGVALPRPQARPGFSPGRGVSCTATLE